MTNLKLGRAARTFNPQIPQFSAMTAGRNLPPPPDSVDWTAKLAGTAPGEMLNDQINDCSCAAFYHAMQVWTGNINPPPQTQPDTIVEQLYCAVSGWNPASGGQGPPCSEQAVLTYLVNHGAPLAGGGVNRLAAFVEIDPHDIDDVKRCIAACGVAYIGFQVPQYLLPAPPPLWQVQTGNDAVAYDHAVILVGYDAAGATLISWGHRFKMTWDFFVKYTDEAYALVDQAWVDAKGTTPGGIGLDALKQQMLALRANCD